MHDDRFERVSVVKKANVYYEGRVTSRTVLFPDGTRKTLGIMLPGSYEFNTGMAEVMDVLEGEMKVLLPGSSGWEVFKAGQSYSVPANSTFKLEITGLVDYCCSYLG